jgi:2,3-bisphosphoglycerate-independent phosphoglycerate mutase
LIGLLSSGNVHSSIEHCFALLDLAKKQKVKNVFIHVVLDGRDTTFNSASDFVKRLQEKIKETKIGEIATVSGRFYAMDRDNRWDRTEKAYRAMVNGKSDEFFSDPLKAIEASYEKKVYDEEFVPVVITKKDKPVGSIKNGDAAIFFNYRPDRARQLTNALVLPGFSKFEREYFKDLFFVTMTEYEKELPVIVAYPPQVVQNSLAEVISNSELKQFHIAETEKYAHITFFLNGTIEDAFNGEDRQIIPSPKVSSYDQAPEMSAALIAKEVIKAIESEKYDAIMINFANADMVAHTGKLNPTIKACEAIDKALEQVTDHTLAKDGIVLITADHGNAEEVINLQTGEMDKEHSNNSVPFIIVSNSYRGQAGPAGEPPEGDLSLMHPVGMLADVAPTMLRLMGIPQPKEMSGRSLI